MNYKSHLIDNEGKRLTGRKARKIRKMEVGMYNKYLKEHGKRKKKFERKGVK